MLGGGTEYRGSSEYHFALRLGSGKAGGRRTAPNVPPTRGGWLVARVREGTTLFSTITEAFCHASFRVMDAIVRCGGLEPIRNEWERHTTEVVRPGFVTGNVIHADTKDLAVCGMYFIAYRRKDGHFVRSTSGEITREKEDNDLLSAQPTQRYILAGVRRQGEIWCLCSNV